MNAATMKVLESAGKAAWKAAKAYVDKDLHTYYPLEHPVHAVFSGRGIGIGKAGAGPLTIRSKKGGSIVELSVKPFAAETKFWNGPNVIPNDWKDGSFEASLYHDLIWEFKKELAQQLGVSEKYLLDWSNGILVAAWRGYAKFYHLEEAVAPKTKSWLAYQFCKVGAWLRLHGMDFGIIVVSALALIFTAAGCSGCSSPPDWEMDSGDPVVSVEGGAATNVPAEK